MKSAAKKKRDQITISGDWARYIAITIGQLHADRADLIAALQDLQELAKLYDVKGTGCCTFGCDLPFCIRQRTDALLARLEKGE